MISNFFSKFRLDHEREDAKNTIETISKGVVFRGTNLWVLIFAIMIASLGLNVNSTAVIIGAMLISPLMGPIMGIGLGIGVYDLALLRKSIYNYCVATGVALATSTFFFLLSPLNAAHSELLARTSPTIYDVLIALFGGLAGIIATASTLKGNVIPGVAIATALMPPLCTAGYGLATLKWTFFIGAFYLFIINTVFIALATFITVRLLRFPFSHLPDRKADRRAHRIIWGIVLTTVIPSLYFGYDIVQQNKFTQNANLFIDTEATLKNDYLLNRKIDARQKTIILTYGGQEITDSTITYLKSKLKNFGLADASLQVHQGFAYLASMTENDDDNEKAQQLEKVLKAKDDEMARLRSTLDSEKIDKITTRNIYDELKVQYSDLERVLLGQGNMANSDTLSNLGSVVILQFKKRKTTAEKNKAEEWLKVRLRKKNLTVIFE